MNAYSTQDTSSVYKNFSPITKKYKNDEAREYIARTVGHEVTRGLADAVKHLSAAVANKQK